MDQPPTDVAESLEPAVSWDDIEAEVRYAEASFPAPDASVYHHTVRQYRELEKISSANANAHAIETLTSMRDNTTRQLGKLQVIKGQIIAQSQRLDAANNALEQQKDYQQLQILSSSLQNRLQELQHNYDGTVLKCLLCGYAEQYGFVVTQQCEQAAGTILRVVIQFVIKEKPVSDFPVQIDIATATNKIAAISTKIYPEEKLMKWLNAHEYAILDVIVKLRKTLANLLSSANM